MSIRKIKSLKTSWARGIVIMIGVVLVMGTISVEAGTDGRGMNYDYSLIIDNTDPSPTFITTGNWPESAAQYEYNGSSLYANQDGATATWTPDLPVDGLYKVYAWWSYWETRAENAPYTINYLGGSDTVRVNQRENAGQWNLLGSYEFQSGTNGNITVTREGGDGTSTNADAVRFIYVEEGDIYYVSTGEPSGQECASDSNDGLCPDCSQGGSSGPFKTIQKAADVATAGDTVYIRGGTYSPTNTITPQNSGMHIYSYINYEAYLDEEVIINQDNLPDGSRFFLIQGKSFIKIKNIKIHGNYDPETSNLNYSEIGILIRGSDNIVVSGVELTNINGIGIFSINWNYTNTPSTNILIKDNSTYNTKSSGIRSSTSDYIIIEGNDVQKAVNGGVGECIIIAAGTSNFEVKNNTVHNGSGLFRGGEGIDIKTGSNNGSVHDNIVYDLPGEIGIYIDAYNAHTYDINIYSNISYNNCIGIALGSEEGGQLENIKVYNNIVHNNWVEGIILTDWVGDTQGRKTNIEIYNNTVYKNGNSVTQWGGGISLISDHPNDSNFIVRNNIISDNALYQFRVGSAAKTHLTSSNNLINGYCPDYVNPPFGWCIGDEEIGPDDAVYCVDCLDGDPLFFDATGYDFRLRLGSPAIDVGIDLTAEGVTQDFRGNPRPIDGNGDSIAEFDMGAYEYIGGEFQYSLTVHLDGTGVGAVTSSPVGIDNIDSSPAFIPVATFGIGNSGGFNSVLFALEFLALKDKKIKTFLKKIRVEQQKEVIAKSERFKKLVKRR